MKDNVFSVVSCVYNGDMLRGFLIADSFGATAEFVNMDRLCQVADSIELANARYDNLTGTLVGVGSNLVDYPRITPEYNLTTRDSLTVLANIMDKDANKVIGITCMNGRGKTLHITFDKLLKALLNYGTTNFQPTVGSDGSVTIDCSNPNDLPVVYVKKSPKEDLSYRSAKGESAPVYKVADDLEGLPTVGEYSLASVSTDIDNATTQQKMLTAKFNLKKLSPYYYVIYEGIEKKLAPGLGTFGVTENCMYYDHKFTASLSEAEIVFVLIHEMCHICMQHSIRKGGRDHKLWNIATDLYINSIIMSDFELKRGYEKEIDGGRIKAPNFGVFLEDIGETIDLSKDTPESIYARLAKENPPQSPIQISIPAGAFNQLQQQAQQQSMQQAQQQIQQGIQQVQQGAQQAQQNANNNAQSQQAQQQIQQGIQQVQQGMQQAQQGQQDGNQQQVQQGLQQAQQGLQQIQQGCQQMNDAQQGADSDSQQQASSQMAQGVQNIRQGLSKANNQGQSGQGGNGVTMQVQQSGGSHGDGQSSQDNQSGQNNNQNNQQGQQGSYSQGRVDGDGGNSDTPQMQQVRVTYNGKTLTGTVMMDVMTNDNKKGDDEVNKRISESKSALQKVKTKMRMEEEKLGKTIDKSLTGADLTQRYIDFGLSSGIDWRVLMKNMCVDKPKRMYTLAMPNQDYMNMGITLAERHKIGKPTRAAKFVVAIDVSGSVSQNMLNWYLSEVNNLTKKYDVEAELVYWSTEVGDAGSFNDLKDMLKVKPNSTGGTDVRCLFEYLVGKTTTQTGKKEPLKVRDIKGVFIITDGCFDTNYEEFGQYFNTKTIWLIDGNPVTFKSLFGRVIGLKRED